MGDEFQDNNEEGFFRLNSIPLKQIEEEYARASIDYIEGYRAGWSEGRTEGYEQGMSDGYSRGYYDLLHQLKRYADESYDLELEEVVKEITGE